jgi:ubiquinone biosynthesis protein UbiJ
MSEKSQDVAKQAGLVAKKAGKVLGTGLSKLSQKVKETSKSFKEGLKEDEHQETPVQEVEYGGDEVSESEPVKPASIQTDYSLDE